MEPRWTDSRLLRWVTASDKQGAKVPILILGRAFLSLWILLLVIVLIIGEVGGSDVPKRTNSECIIVQAHPETWITDSDGAVHHVDAEYVDTCEGVMDQIP